MEREIDIRELTKEAERGEPCNLKNALDSMNFSEKVRALNAVIDANKADRANNAGLPEMSLSKSMSTDSQGIPVAELRLNVPGVMNYESNLSLNTGANTGVSTLKKQCRFSDDLPNPRPYEEYKKEQERFKAMVSELETGNPCNFMNAMDKMDFESKIRSFNKALSINKEHRAANPSLPEMSLEKMMRRDSQGIPVAELQLKVPGILDHKSELEMKNGNVIGIATTKRQCGIPAHEGRFEPMR